MNSIAFAIPDALFFWLKVFIPVLFVLRITKSKLPYVDEALLIEAANITLLLAATIEVLYYPVEFLVAYFSAVEYVQYSFISRATGPYWFAFWIPVFIYFIMPQMMWVKKIRRSVKSSYAWCILALMFSLFLYLVMNSMFMNRDYLPTSAPLFSGSAAEYTYSLLMFLVIFGVIYASILKLNIATVQKANFKSPN